MAVQVGQPGHHRHTTVGAPTSWSFTIKLRLDSLPAGAGAAGQGTLFYLGRTVTSAQGVLCVYDSTIGRLRLYDRAGVDMLGGNGPTVAAGVWYQYGVTGNTSAGVDFYFSQDGGATVAYTGLTFSGGTYQLDRLAITGGRPEGETNSVNTAASWAFARFWSGTVLTQTQVEAEWASDIAVVTPWADWPGGQWNAAGTSSRNLNELLAGGTLTPISAPVGGLAGAPRPWPASIETFSSTTVSANRTTNYSFNAPAGTTVLVVVSNWRSFATNTDTTTISGSCLTSIVKQATRVQVSGADNIRVTAFSAVATGTSSTILASQSDGTTRGNWTVQTFAVPDMAVVQTAANGGSGTSVTATLAALASQPTVMLAWHRFNNSTTPTPESGHVLLGSSNFQATQLLYGSDTTPSATQGSTLWAALGIELRGTNVGGDATVTSAASIAGSGTVSTPVVEVFGAGTVTSSTAVAGAGVREPLGAATVTSTSSIVAAASVDRAGVATVSSAAAIAGSGQPETVGAATVTSATSVAAAATVEHAGSGAVASSTSVAGAGARDVTGTATVESSGAVVSSATREALGDPAVSSTGVIAASGAVDRTGSASVASGAAITAAATRDVAGVGAVSSDGLIAAAGSSFSLHEGSATVESSCSIVGSGSREVSGASTVSSDGSIAATASRAVDGQGTVTSATSVAALGSGTGVGAGAGYVESVGSIAAAGERAVTGTATVTSASAIAAAGIRSVVGTADVTSSGDVAASGTSAPVVDGTALVEATGAVSGTGTVTRQGAATVTSQAGIGGAAERDAHGSGAITSPGVIAGSGAVSGDLTGNATVTSPTVITGTGARGTAGAGAVTAEGGIAARGATGATPRGSRGTVTRRVGDGTTGRRHTHGITRPLATAGTAATTATTGSTRRHQ